MNLHNYVNQINYQAQNLLLESRILSIVPVFVQFLHLSLCNYKVFTKCRLWKPFCNYFVALCKRLNPPFQGSEAYNFPFFTQSIDKGMKLCYILSWQRLWRKTCVPRKNLREGPIWCEGSGTLPGTIPLSELWGGNAPPVTPVTASMSDGFMP